MNKPKLIKIKDYQSSDYDCVREILRDVLKERKNISSIIVCYETTDERIKSKASGNLGVLRILGMLTYMKGLFFEEHVNE